MFGIKCFVSDHQGFKGRLKYHPNDFVVTEISTEGEMVCLGDKHNRSNPVGNSSVKKSTSCDSIDSVVKANCHREMHHSLTSSKYDEAVKLLDVIKSSDTCSAPEKNSVESCSEKSECLIDPNPLEHYETVLSDVLDDRIRTNLKVFAKEELELLQNDLINHEQSISASSTNLDNNINTHQSEMNLGLIPDKEIRTIVHKSVHFIYPHLRTSNHKIPKKDGLEILVTREPTISDFQHLGIKLATILDFIRFVAAKVHGTTFCFERIDSKEQRTKLHRLIAKQYGALLETKTFNDAHSPNQQNIVVRFRQKLYNKKVNKGEKCAAQEMQQFTGFTLQKVNIETLNAIQKLARMVGVHPSDFSYAGIKDKKAVTTQQMAVKGVTTSRMKACIANVLCPGLKIGNIHARDGPFHLGQLQGNHFSITVRDVNLNKNQGDEHEKDMEKILQECVENSIKNVQEKGFLNYFGEQRFGASSLNPERALTSITSADVGRAMLQGNYKEAVNLILTSDDGPAADSTDPVNIAKCCYRETGSAKKALRLMPPNKTRECMILKALNRHGTDCDGCIKALLSLPHSIRQMYVYSFCSLLWNRMVSNRMSCYGYQIVEGDLVLGGEGATSKTKVHSVTKDDIATGRFSAADIVLPLPGNNIQYPTHKVGAAYQGALADAGLEECTFRLPALKLNIPGDYRKIIIQPSSLISGWGSDDITDKKFDNEDANGSSGVIIQDKKQLQGIPAVIGRNHTPGNTTTCECHFWTQCDSNAMTHRGNDSKTRHKMLDSTTTKTTCRERTLTLSFNLPASSYATMCLRELMKSEGRFGASLCCAASCVPYHSKELGLIEPCNT